MTRIGFSYNPDRSEISDLDILKSAGIDRAAVEYQIWKEKPSRKHIDDVDDIVRKGYVVDSVHLPNHDFYEADFDREMVESILYLQDRIPELSRVVFHPPRTKGSKSDIFKDFLNQMSRVGSQVDVDVNTENVRGTLINSYNDVRKLSDGLEDTFLDNLGITLDTTHIPIWDNKEQNMDTWDKFVESAGDRLNEIHVSESRPVKDKENKFHGHNPLDGSSLDWAYIMPTLIKYPSYFEMIHMKDIEKSYRFVREELESSIEDSIDNLDIDLDIDDKETYI